MKKSIYLSIYISIYLSFSLNGHILNRYEKGKGTSIERNTIFNLEELKVRWKKAALENCPGVPYITATAAGSPTSVVATNAVGSSAASAASAAVTPAAASSCPTLTITDVDGNVYNTVSIGTQCWTKTNLKVTKYNDNTSIPLDATGGSGGTSGTWAGLTTGAYTIYGNESNSGANATNYGFLYNWYAAKGITTTGSTTYKNICPTGYHVPTDSDWNKLVKFIDSGADTSSTSSTQSTTAGTKLKKNDALWTTNTGTDDYGFSGLPGGWRYSDGFFYVISIDAFFWSATEYDSYGAWFRNLNYYNGYVDGYGNFNFISKSVGASVRCLRD